MSQTPGTRGGLRAQVVDVARRPADPAAREAPHEVLDRDVDSSAAIDLGRARRARRRAPRPGARVRGKPSRIAPSAASGRRGARGTCGSIEVVGHELARVHDTPWPRARASRARRDAAAAGRRTRDAGRPSALLRADRPPACPCPRRARPHARIGARDCDRSSRLTNEALVVAHHQLRFDLLHRLDHDATRR